MGIMTRMLRLCKADVHGVMDQLEDKGLLLKQYLREMEVSLADKEQQVNSLSQRIEWLNRQVALHGKEMDKLERDLNLALEKEKDNIARMLIRRRRVLETTCMHLKEQVETITREKSKLAEILVEQHLQYETLKSKTDTYCQRAGDRLLVPEAGINNGRWASIDPKEEEVELELLQRKEALQKGGLS